MVGAGKEGDIKHDIGNYLSELDICVDELGGRVNLAGMCQGGWLGAMYAARFPDKVNTLDLRRLPFFRIVDIVADTTQIFCHLPTSSFKEVLN